MQMSDAEWQEYESKQDDVQRKRWVACLLALRLAGEGASGHEVWRLDLLPGHQLAAWLQDRGGAGRRPAGDGGAAAAATSAAPAVGSRQTVKLLVCQYL